MKVHPSSMSRKLFILLKFSLVMTMPGACVPTNHSRTVATAETEMPAVWRSKLYPNDWSPSYTDNEGRFLHDFSYAGYKRGEQPIPNSEGRPIWNVQAPPYSADASGQSNAALAIQKAIDDAAQAGGGLVYIPAGNYRLDFADNEKSALLIKHSGIVLRGEGPASRLFTLESNMRDRSLIRVGPPQNTWSEPDRKTSIPLKLDAPSRATTLALETLGDLKAGDSVIIRSDVTPEFARELGMSGLWEGKVDGPNIYRQITAVDPASRSISIDVPVRFSQRVRDFARVHRVLAPVQEIGIENISFGMRQLTLDGLAEDDHEVPGTAGYQSHRSFAVKLQSVENSWIKGVSSYQLDQNPSLVHLLSGGILVERSRFVTLAQNQLAFPLYKGAGGNGYLFEIANSQDILVRDSTAQGGRHNFDLKYMGTSGVVFLRCQAKDGYKSTDFHMHLSAAVLFDNTLVDGDNLEARYRDSGTIKHGQSATESVFWNTKGLRYAARKSTIVSSQQWGWGYVIGTQGPAANVETPPAEVDSMRDWLEGVGQGASLEPASLYEDQLRRRLSATTE